MITKDKYAMKVVLNFILFLLFIVIGSFVVSLECIDLAYVIAFLIFAFKFFRLD